MGKKLFYMEFNVGDWLKDPAVSMLRPSTRGIWIDAICAMHELDQCGELTGSADDLARVCRCTSNEMRAALDDLKLRNAAEITESDRGITLTNRRMRRRWTDRISNRGKQLRHRNQEHDAKCNADITGEPPGTISITLPFNSSDSPPGGWVTNLGHAIPPSLRTPDFVSAWNLWANHRLTIKHPLTAHMVESQFRGFERGGVDLAVATIENTVSHGWWGLRAPDAPREARQNGRPVTRGQQKQANHLEALNRRIQP